MNPVELPENLPFFVSDRAAQFYVELAGKTAAQVSINQLA